MPRFCGFAFEPYSWVLCNVLIPSVRSDRRSTAFDSMTAYLLTVHALNLLAPAAALAWLMAVLAPLLVGPRAGPPRMGWRRRFLWGLLVNGLVVMASLFFASPGKVLVYSALVAASALTQSVLLGLWRR